MTVSEYYPKFSLSALLGSATAVSGESLFSGGASQSAAELGLRWRLFDFGRINAQIDQAKGQKAEALAAYRLSVLRATEDVENAFSALINRETQAATLTRGETAQASARQSFFIAYRQRTASLMDVLHNDENLLQASDARAQAQTESARAAVICAFHGRSAFRHQSKFGKRTRSPIENAGENFVVWLETRHATPRCDDNPGQVAAQCGGELEMQNRLEYSGWDHVINRVQTHSVNFNQNFINSGGWIIDVIESQLRIFIVAFKRKCFDRLILSHQAEDFCAPLYPGMMQGRI